VKTVNRRFVGMAGAMLLAAFGTVMIVGYVKGADGRARDGQQTVQVLVVKKTVPPGTPAEQLGDRVALDEVVKDSVADGAIADVKDVHGRVTSAALVPGEQLVQARFVDSSAYRAGGAGVTVPAGLLQTTIKLDAERAVGGLLTPGVKVAVTTSFDDKSSGAAASTHTLLHHVLVTNVQVTDSSDAEAYDNTEDAPENATAPGNAPTGQILVTLALDVSAVERVVFTAERGSIWLSVEPDNATVAGSSVVTRESVQ
jgi:pilus assembly protein CpaB